MKFDGPLVFVLRVFCDYLQCYCGMPPVPWGDRLCPLVLHNHLLLFPTAPDSPDSLQTYNSNNSYTYSGIYLPCCPQGLVNRSPSHVTGVALWYSTILARDLCTCGSPTTTYFPDGVWSIMKCLTLCAARTDREYPNLVSLTRIRNPPIGIPVSSFSACLRVIIPWNHSWKLPSGRVRSVELPH